jgi:hypothetical protein
MTEALTNLIVQPGEEKVLTARLHQFSDIHLMKGGRVVIAPQSARWSIWWVEGEVLIEGAVIGLNFSTSATAITDSTPDGKTISHQFLNAAEGGTGGAGGTSGIPGGHTSQGGLGARGTAKYGGGGGSPGGIHIQGSSTHIGGPGQTAIDWRGAPPAANGGYDYRGGDGGKSPRHPNGALLVIRTKGNFRSVGEFNFSAQRGEDGQAGSAGYDSNRGWIASGGGGGGAPGGDGGRLVIIAAAFDNRGQFKADAGIGGRGGAGGSPAHGATAGTKGENGDQGFLDEIPIDQWTSGAINITPRPK